MKKGLLYIGMACVLGTTACKEKGPDINFGNVPVAKDTSYIAAVEEPQKRTVIVEEFTGASCPPCPPARELLNSVANANQGRVFPIEIHIKNYPQSAPAEGHKYDFRTDDGTSIGKTIYGNVRSMPSAGVARIPVSNQLLLDNTQWAGAIGNTLATNTPVNVIVSSAFDASTSVANIKVKISYTAAVNAKQYLTLAIIEDSIVDVQEYADSFDHNYLFRHVLRDVITPITGDEILADITSKEPGRVCERIFTYNVDAAWKPEHCKIIAFVHNYDANSKEILQGAETSLEGE